MYRPGIFWSVEGTATCFQLLLLLSANSWQARTIFSVVRDHMGFVYVATPMGMIETKVNAIRRGRCKSPNAEVVVNKRLRKLIAKDMLIYRAS